MSDTGYIYTLNDPRTGEPMYVGATQQKPKERLRQHKQTPTNEDAREWLDGLVESGLEPLMTVVRFTDIDKLNEEERQVYEQLSDEYELLNKEEVNYTLREVESGGSKIVSASLPPELVDALEAAVENNPELSQAQVVREGLRMRLQMDQ